MVRGLRTLLWRTILSGCGLSAAVPTLDGPHSSGCLGLYYSGLAKRISCNDLCSAETARRACALAALQVSAARGGDRDCEGMQWHTIEPCSVHYQHPHWTPVSSVKLEKGCFQPCHGTGSRL